MIAGVRWASVVAAMLTVASACPAAESPAGEGKPANSGYRSGGGGVGGQFGGSDFVAGGDYSAGAQPRLSFAAHWRYAFTSWLRGQVGPGLGWAGYNESEPVPMTDPRFPQDTRKGNYLSLLVPVSVQLQCTMRRQQWLYYVGAGPGVYRVWVENRREVVKDPVTLRRHRGLYAGASGQLGVERFLKMLPSTSVEVSAGGDLALTLRDEQFRSGFNSRLLALYLRVGANYYFKPGEVKKKQESAPLPRP